MFLCRMVLLSSMVCATCYSQTEFELNPLIVSAARVEQHAQDALRATSTISRTDIDQRQALDVPSLLQAETGIEIIQNGGMGQPASLQMRGARGAQNLVLLDGIEINSASNGAAQLAHIMTDQIDRIEIVRGNVSALYGSSAMGGVVQIFTQTAQEAPPTGRAMVRIGSYQTQSVQAKYGGRIANNAFYLNVSQQHSDSFPAVNAAQAPSSNQQDHGYQNKTISGQFRHYLNAHWDGGIRFFQTHATTHFASPYGSPSDVHYAHAQIATVSAFINGQANEQWQTQLTISQSIDANNSYTVSNFYPNTALFRTTHRKLAWQNTFTIAPQNTLFIGYEYAQQQLNTTSYDAPKRTIDSYFLGYQTQIQAHQVQLNLRQDHYSDFGRANSYFLGYGYRLTSYTKGFLNISNAFRAPTFNDLYFPNNNNPNLQAEHARTTEVGWQYAPALGLLQLSLFQTKYRDLIAYTNTGPPRYAFSPDNIHRALAQGVEATFSTIWGNTEAKANITWQQPKNEIDGTLLPNQARQFGQITLNQKIGATQLGAMLHISGPRLDKSSGQVHILGGYNLVHLTARHTITKNWTLAAKLENIFNRNYQTIYRYNTPGRSFYCTLLWQPL
ncbi:MAG: TonB-dependent receptor [Ottowia sp.]|nr:TonB-dependent receptor [Ottowia sp.]